MQFVQVVRSQDLPDRHPKMAWVGERPIVVVRSAGALYALHGLCSHQKKPLEGGRVSGTVLDCPWHHFQWDLETGENVYPKPVYPLGRRPDLRAQVETLRTYPVRDREGHVEVGAPPEETP